MNWGTGIVWSFVLFCGYILFLVYQSVQLDFNLVSENYYQEELKYQERIIQKSNLYHSGSRISVSQTDSRQVQLVFPKNMRDANGTIYFYSPTEKSFDKKYVILLDEVGAQQINRTELVAGRYTLKIEWNSRDRAYYQEAELFVQ